MRAGSAGIVTHVPSSSRSVTGKPASTDGQAPAGGVEGDADGAALADAGAAVVAMADGDAAVGVAAVVGEAAAVDGGVVAGVAFVAAGVLGAPLAGADTVAPVPVHAAASSATAISGARRRRARAYRGRASGSRGEDGERVATGAYLSLEGSRTTVGPATGLAAPQGPLTVAGLCRNRTGFADPTILCSVGPECTASSGRASASASVLPGDLADDPCQVVRA